VLGRDFLRSLVVMGLLKTFFGSRLNVRRGVWRRYSRAAGVPLNQSLSVSNGIVLAQNMEFVIMRLGKSACVRSTGAMWQSYGVRGYE
jgi:hypothetical protein